MQIFQFEGSAAAITGAASGIGRALAVELAARGCDLALADLDLAGLESTAKEIAAEVVREKCFINLDQEIPYNLAVSVRSFKEDKKMNRIECDILVAREGQKGIVRAGSAGGRQY